MIPLLFVCNSLQSLLMQFITAIACTRLGTVITEFSSSKSFPDRANQPEYLLDRIGEICGGDVGAHSLVECADTAQYREIRVDTDIVAGRSSVADRAGKGYTRYIVLCRETRRACRSFAHRGLTVEYALSGDEQVGYGDVGFEPGNVEHKLDA